MKNTTILISALMLMMATTFAQTVNVTGISLPETMDVSVGNGSFPSAKITPTNASNRKIIWSSNNEEVATVNETGLVSGISPGMATITATTEDGGFTATCEVTVAYVPVTDISLFPETLDIDASTFSFVTHLLTATITPSDASDTVIWSSSNEAVVIIRNNVYSGGHATAYIRGISAGTATITATTEDGGVTATCEVTVTYVPVTGISLPETLDISVGSKSDLFVEMKPTNASNQEIIWGSSNEEVATVNENGRVSGISAGTATITATTVEGDFTATCEVTVAYVPVTGISLPETLDISVGGGSGLPAEITPTNASNRKIIWSSSNEAVATVNEYGYVSGISQGTVTITATTEDGGFTATCEVTVTYVPVTDISFSVEKVDNIDAGSEGYLYAVASITPANASNREIIWSSSNEAVVTTERTLVDGEYIYIYIKAGFPGKATITATTEDGGFTATCEVTVNSIDVEGISLNTETLDINVGYSSSLYAEITPNNPTNRKIIWSSSNEEVATVNETGRVSGISAGTATITATTEDGGFTATCEVTVTYVAVSGISLPATLNVNAGSKSRLDASITPDNASNRKIIWSSSNEAVAIVEEDEYVGYVNGISAGTAIITATTVDGDFTAMCEVTVTNVAVEGISLPETLNISAGNKSYLSVTIEPINPSNSEIIWISSDETVATVGQYVYNYGIGYGYGSAFVTGLSAGTAIITATTVDGNFTATCEVTVTYVAVSGISLRETLNVNAGHEHNLYASVTPDNASNRGITWSSSNEEVATVNETGRVSGISAGTATITATTVEGGFTATCEVTVTNVAVTGISLLPVMMDVNAGHESTHPLSVLIMPANASNPEVIWSSSDEAVATVGDYEYLGYGLGFVYIRGISSGTATIAVTTVDGSITATCEVTVSETTGAEAITSTHLAVYPNPTKGIVYLSTETYAQVYTLYGHLLYEGYTNVIDLTPFSKGVYIVRAGNESIQIIKE
jgi:uncharacterized protein YjdB